MDNKKKRWQFLLMMLSKEELTLVKELLEAEITLRSQKFRGLPK